MGNRNSSAAWGPTSAKRFRQARCLDTITSHAGRPTILPLCFLQAASSPKRPRHLPMGMSQNGYPFKYRQFELSPLLRCFVYLLATCGSRRWRAESRHLTCGPSCRGSRQHYEGGSVGPMQAIHSFAGAELRIETTARGHAAFALIPF